MKNHGTHIKNLLVIEIVLLILLIGYLFISKPPTPPLPPEPPLPGPAQQVATQTLQGRVKAYAGNAEGDIDKLGLDKNGETTWLRFPPHVAREVMQQAPPGAEVRVGVSDRNGPARRELSLLELTALEVSISRPGLIIRALAPPPPGGDHTTVSGVPHDFRKDPTGTITAFVLSGYLVILPPAIRQSVSPLLLSAKQLSVQGTIRATGGGFVNTSGLPVLRPAALDIDGVSYLVR